MARPGFTLPGGNMKNASIALEHEQINAQQEEHNLVQAIAISQEEIKNQRLIAQLQIQLLEEQQLREASIKAQMGIWIW
jgi:hypothetical protein